MGYRHLAQRDDSNKTSSAHVSKIKVSATVAEDLTGTDTTTTNCNISHMAFINTILPLLLVYFPDIQKSTRIIANGEFTGQDNRSS